jgi:DNA-directed RNA polymerase specialized sigma24 family protein
VPAQTRSVVWLSLGQGLTHSEIASSLGVSRVAVTRRITRFMRTAHEWRERLSHQEESFLAVAA